MTDEVQRPINVDLVATKTTNYLLGALNNSKAHLGELLAKSRDFDGYDEAMRFLEGMREAILDYDETRSNEQ